MMNSTCRWFDRLALADDPLILLEAITGVMNDRHLIITKKVSLNFARVLNCCLEFNNAQNHILVGGSINFCHSLGG
jgi:hypothetical protein